jgi:hypothetical protein
MLKRIKGGYSNGLGHISKCDSIKVSINLITDNNQYDDNLKFNIGNNYVYRNDSIECEGYILNSGVQR